MEERQDCASYLMHDDKLDLAYISEQEATIQALLLEREWFISRIRELEGRLHPELLKDVVF